MNRKDFEFPAGHNLSDLTTDGDGIVTRASQRALSGANREVCLSNTAHTGQEASRWREILAAIGDYKAPEIEEVKYGEDGENRFFVKVKDYLLADTEVRVEVDGKEMTTKLFPKKGLSFVDEFNEEEPGFLDQYGNFITDDICFKPYKTQRDSFLSSYEYTNYVTDTTTTYGPGVFVFNGVSEPGMHEYTITVRNPLGKTDVYRKTVGLPGYFNIVKNHSTHVPILPGLSAFCEMGSGGATAPFCGPCIPGNL